MNFLDRLPYRLLTLVSLALFYGIYFTKMLIQKRQGIITHQIGRRKEPKLHAVETLMSIATFGIVPVQLISVAFHWSRFPAAVRFAGFFVGLLGDLIFLISTVTMKDSWRAGIPEKDKTALVTSGIYRFSRNPAFLGFDLMYLGVFLLFGNGATFVFTIFCMVMLHLQILQEERYLTATFGEAYKEYRGRVLRYFGRKIGRPAKK